MRPMHLILAPMEGLADYWMRRTLTDTGAFDACVSEFVRVSGANGALVWVDPANPDAVFAIDTGTGSAQRPSAVR